MAWATRWGKSKARNGDNRVLQNSETNIGIAWQTTVKNAFRAMFTLYWMALASARKPHIPDRASVHTQERWFRRDFCNGAPGRTPYNGLYGETLLERSTFLRLEYIYLDLWNPGLAKISTHSTSWQFKTIKLVQRPIKSVYLTPGSKLMVPRSIPTSPNLKWRKS